MNRVLERFGAGRTGENVENGRRAAHVGHVVGPDSVVDDTGVEFTETDVCPADRRHSPGEAPAVGVEHGECPEVYRMFRYGPVDQ